MEKPLVDKSYLLQKFPGKGGWTYAAIPEIPQDRKTYFGWVKVKGSIDGFTFSKYNLAPMGNGQLFLPVKKEIRRKIRKEAGDTVHVILYADNDPTETPEELVQCLKEVTGAWEHYNTLADREQEQYVKWIYSAKTDQTKVERIARSLDNFSKHKILARYDETEK